MNTSYDFDELLARAFSGESLNAEQKAQLDAYIRENGDEYARLQRVMEGLDFKPKAMNVSVEDSWRQIEPRLKTTRKTIIRPLYAALAVASCLLLLIGSGTMAYRKFLMTTTYAFANTTDRKQTILLPDSSNVEVYPHSSVRYAQKGTNGDRRVELEGKGYFDVKGQEGSVFTVSAADLKVEVLGTAFTIDAYDKNNKQVIVTRGRVKVSASEQSVVLNKNQSVTYTNGKMVQEEISAPQDDKKGKKELMTFDNAPMGAVVAKLQKQLNIRIELGEGVADNRITTQIDPSQIDAVIQELSYLCGCRYAKLAKGRYRMYY